MTYKIIQFGNRPDRVQWFISRYPFQPARKVVVPEPWAQLQYFV